MHQYSPNQAHSAPARGWDIGSSEGSHSGAALQYQGSALVGESGPWSHLQTFARSAPGHDDQSSQDSQIEAIPQWPSNLQGYEMLHSSTTESRHQHQASAKHWRMQQNPYSAEGNRTQHSRLRNPSRSARSLRLANLGSFQHGTPHADEQQMGGSSASSSFSQPATSGLHMESNHVQFPDDSRSTYLLQHATFKDLEGSNTGLCRGPEIDYSPNRGLIEESGHNSLSASRDIVTPQEVSWRQDGHVLFGHSLSASADTTYGSYDLGFAANDPGWPSDLMPDPALGFAMSQTDDDTNTLDHPGAIKIERSSGHYKSDLTSTFPPSADCFPDYISTTQIPRQRRATASTSQPTFHSSSPPTLTSRKDPNKSISRRPRADSLSVIREYGHSQRGSPNLSRSGSVKGKRKGPLPTATALAAAQKRKDGSVCIRCRTMKMTVGRSGRISWELSDRIVVQRGPSLRRVSTDYKDQTVGPVLYPCEFRRYN